MAQIRQYHKDTDTTYVYESESYWDPEKKQSRSRRRVIGKIDPATGEIIPTGKRGRKPKEVPAVTAASADQEELKKQYEGKCRENKELQLQLAECEEKLRSLQKTNDRLLYALKQTDSLAERIRTASSDLLK